jgi:uncharacterized caspase-like protein
VRSARNATRSRRNTAILSFCTGSPVNPVNSETSTRATVVGVTSPSPIGESRQSVLAFLLLCITLTTRAHAEKRVALVIGNGAYKTVAILPNPPRDAVAIGDLFKAAGFDGVVVKTDLGVNEMRAELREFARSAIGADIAVVFYAGHGIEVGGHNYLVPIDAKLEFDTDAEDEAVDLDHLLRQLETVKRLKLVILDACRDNPFAPRMRSLIHSRDIIGRGLSPPSHESSDTLVAYAAAPGETAADGDGSHSPFTSALLNNLTRPGTDIRLALGKVRDEVLSATNSRQIPFITGSLGGYNLSLGAPDAPVASGSEPSVEQAFEKAMRADTVSDLEAFLAQYPRTSFADIARRERDRLSAAAVVAPLSVVPAALPIRLPATKPRLPVRQRINVKTPKNGGCQDIGGAKFC